MLSTWQHRMFLKFILKRIYLLLVPHFMTFASPMFQVSVFVLNNMLKLSKTSLIKFWNSSFSGLYMIIPVSSAQSTGLDSEVTVQGILLCNKEWKEACETPMLCNAPVWRGVMVWIWRLKADTLFSVKKVWLEPPNSYTMVSIKT